MSRSVLEGELAAAEDCARQQKRKFDILVDHVTSFISAIAAERPINQLPFRLRAELEELCRVTGIARPW